MLSSIFLTVIGVGIILLLLKWKKQFIGTENRHKYFAETFKEFPIFYNGLTGHMKKKLFEPLHDTQSKIPELCKEKRIRVLEIGAGSGANLEYFPANTNLVVVDPNPYFKDSLVENMSKYPTMKLEKCVVSGAEDMKDVADKSIDAVVSTLVMCSCNEVGQIYKEICRVLAPGGKFYFMEHVLDDRTSLLKIIQKLLGSLGIFQFFFDGCRPDRDIEPELKKNGFLKLDAKRFRLPLKFKDMPLSLIPVYAVEPHLYGTATVPA